MPANVEIKAVLNDPERAEQVAARLSGAEVEVIGQVDVFFQAEGARLKLRTFGPRAGELIRYERANVAAARASRYVLARTPDPDNLLDILAATLGTAGTVIKTRRLYMVGQTRVHIDNVEGLGAFLELEVVLGPGQTEEEGRGIAAGLLTEFGIGSDQLVAEAYIDLLRRREAGAGAGEFSAAVS
jgi:predicted adenylyl cyclase CyaB